MEDHEFPRRMFTKGGEPLPNKSIHYFSGRRELLDALKPALQKDEWDELLASEFGVFLRWYELDFNWCSRMVHYMLSMQLACTNKYEIWSLVGVQPVRFSLNEFERITGLNCEYVENLESPDVEVTDEMQHFWNLIGVAIEVGPSYKQLEAACANCSGWERNFRIWLGYLAIYVSFIEAQHWTAASRAAIARQLLVPGALGTYPWGRLAFKILIDSVKIANNKLIQEKNYQIEGFAEVLNVWIFWAVPAMATLYGEPLPNDPVPPLLAYKGSRNRKKVAENLRNQTRVNNLVLKNFEDMFPEWDNDNEADEGVVNMVNAMFGRLGQTPWRWGSQHWIDEGVFETKASLAKVEVGLLKFERSPVESRKIGKGVKRKLEAEGEEGYVDSVLKRAKTGEGYLSHAEAVHMFQEMKQHFTIALDTMFAFVKESLTGMTNKLEEIGNDVAELKRERGNNDDGIMAEKEEKEEKEKKENETEKEEVDNEEKDETKKSDKEKEKEKKEKSNEEKAKEKKETDRERREKEKERKRIEKEKKKEEEKVKERRRIEKEKIEEEKEKEKERKRIEKEKKEEEEKEAERVIENEEKDKKENKGKEDRPRRTVVFQKNKKETEAEAERKGKAIEKAPEEGANKQIAADDGVSLENPLNMNEPIEETDFKPKRSVRLQQKNINRR